jgi:hypothetical protein
VVVLGFELDLAFTTQVFLSLEPCPQPFFALIIFQIGSQIAILLLMLPTQLGSHAWPDSLRSLQ